MNIYIYNFKIYHFQLSSLCDCHMNYIDDHKGLLKVNMRFIILVIILKENTAFDAVFKRKKMR